MNYKIPGLFSIVLAFIALTAAACQLLSYSLILGIFYIIFIPLGFIAVLFIYCRQCPHILNNSCRHVIFGLIVRKLFKPANPTKYSLKKIILMGGILAVIALFPQYWLIRNTVLFITFWILMIAAVIIIRKGVCVSCKNTYCSLCPNSKCSNR